MLLNVNNHSITLWSHWLFLTGRIWLFYPRKLFHFEGISMHSHCTRFSPKETFLCVGKPTHIKGNLCNSLWSGFKSNPGPNQPISRVWHTSSKATSAADLKECGKCLGSNIFLRGLYHNSLKQKGNDRSIQGCKL